MKKDNQKKWSVFQSFSPDDDDNNIFNFIKNKKQQENSAVDLLNEIICLNPKNADINSINKFFGFVDRFLN